MPAPPAALARTIYNGRVTPQVYRFDPAAGGPLAPANVRAERPLRWAAWHPADGSCLLAGNGGGALRYDGTKLEAIDTGTRHNLRGAAFSPDGAQALLAGNGGAVLLYDGSSFRAIASPTQENLRRVAWHPSGEYALIVGNAGVVLRYDPSTLLRAGPSTSLRGELTPVPGDRAHTLRAIAWRPDGAYALVGAYASRYAGYPRPHALYRCDGRYLQALLASDEEDDFVAVDWHPDGRRALIAGYAYDSQRGTFANKLLTYDGAGFSTRAVEASGALLGAAWRPATAGKAGAGEALLCGEGGALLRYAPSAALSPRRVASGDRAGGGRVEQLESGTKENLVGPFWRPDGALALFLRGPSERVYTV
jgi:hypothetical protein